jgi:hypothetical protein
MALPDLVLHVHSILPLCQKAAREIRRPDPSQPVLIRNV